MPPPLLKHFSVSHCRELHDADLAPLYENINNTTSEHRRPTRSLVCSELVILNLSYTSITDASVNGILSKTGKLRELNVNGIPEITVNSLIGAVANNPWLKMINAVHCPKCLLSSEWCSELLRSQCRNVLQVLHVHGIQRGGIKTTAPRFRARSIRKKKPFSLSPSPSPLAVFAHLPYLVSFHIKNCEYLTNTLLNHLTEGCCNTLESLVLKTHCHQLTAEGALDNLFNKCKKLKEVEIGGATSLLTFNRTTRLSKHVTKLSFNGCSLLNDKGIVHLLSYCASNVVHVDISNTAITEKGMQQILSNCKLLHTLRAVKCNEINFRKLNYRLQKGKQVYYSLTNLDVSGCKTSTQTNLAQFIQQYVPLGRLGTASSTVYGHGLGRHGVYPNVQLSTYNINSRNDYFCSLEQCKYCIECIQKITRGYLGRCFAFRKKKYIKQSNARTIQRVWTTYLARKECYRLDRQQKLNKLIQIISCHVYQGVCTQWKKYAREQRRRSASIQIQAGWRAHFCYVGYQQWKIQVKRSAWLVQQWEDVRINYSQRIMHVRLQRFIQLKTFVAHRIHEWKYTHQCNGFIKWLSVTIHTRKQHAAVVLQRTLRLYVWRLQAKKKLKQLLHERNEKIQQELMKKIQLILGKRKQNTFLNVMQEWKHRHMQLYLCRKYLYILLKYAKTERKKRFERQLRAIHIMQRFMMLLLYKKEMRRLRRTSSIDIQRSYRGHLGRRRAFVQNERVRCSILYSRCMWFDVRKEMVNDVSSRSSERIKRDVVKRAASICIQRLFRIYLGKRMMHVLQMYQKHQAAKQIQTTVKKYLTMMLFNLKKNYLHNAANVIRRAYKEYRRKLIYLGIMKHFAVKNADKEYRRKKHVLEKKLEKEKQRKLDKFIFVTATTINSRLAFYWALKKNWRIMKKEQLLLRLEEQDRVAVKKEMLSGERSYQKNTVAAGSDFEKEMASMKLPKKINNLNSHLTKRTFSTLHRTIGWLKFKAYSFRTSDKTKRKRGLPTLKPMLSALEKRNLKKRSKESKTVDGLFEKIQRAKTSVQRFRKGAVSLKLLEHATSSVKTYQRSAVPITGIMNIKFTVGDLEFENHIDQEKVNRRNGRNYYVPINEDMSKSYTRQPDGTRMPLQRCIMWTMTATRKAQDLLCSIKIIPVMSDRQLKKQKAKLTSNKKNKNNTHNNSKVEVEDQEEFHTVKHTRLPFEFKLKRGGTTPIIAVKMIGRTEEKNKLSINHPSVLRQQGYVEIPTEEVKEIAEEQKDEYLNQQKTLQRQTMDKLQITKDKITSRKKNFVQLRAGLKMYAKSVDTTGNLSFNQKILGALTVRDGRKIQNIVNQAMLNAGNVTYLFDLYSKIQYLAYKAMVKSCKSKVEKTKLVKTQYSATNKAFKTITIDAVALYLMEAKTIFTEFVWNMVVTPGNDSGGKSNEDLHLDKMEYEKQKKETRRLQEQLHEGIFIVEGEESKELTFGSFCQGVVRIGMFQEKQLLSLLFTLANPDNITNKISPFALIQTYNSLHGVNGPYNQANQNIQKVVQIMDASNRNTNKIPSIDINTFIELNHRFPSMCWPAFRYVKAFRLKFNQIRWERKSKAFDEARSNLIKNNFA